MPTSAEIFPILAKLPLRDTLELAIRFPQQIKELLADAADMASDEPPPFPGMPKPGGTMEPLGIKPAMDARRPRAPNSAALKDFSERFPEAARIGTQYGSSVTR